MRVIYGLAGTGKSTYLAELIRTERRSYVVLAATHSAVDNIYKITSTVDRKKFMTIYAFFRIDYNTGIVKGPVKQVDIIFIDEFSLLNKYLFERCINKAPNSEFVLCGDPLQLNAIYGVDESIRFKDLRELEGMSILAIEHYHLGIFGLKSVKNSEKIILKTNHRANNAVMKVFNEIFMNSHGIEQSSLFTFLSLDEVIRRLLNNDGTTVLASKYSILQNIFDVIANNSNKYTITIHQKGIKGFSRLYLYEGMELLITENTSYYYNGQRVYFLEYNSKDEYVYVKTETGEILKIDKYKYGNVSEYPLIPSRLITIHKSQGMTLDDIIVCIDELFDISMLYTAITRAKNSVAFYTESQNKLETLQKSSYANTFNELLLKFYSEKR